MMKVIITVPNEINKISTKPKEEKITKILVFDEVLVASDYTRHSNLIIMQRSYNFRFFKKLFCHPP